MWTLILGAAGILLLAVLVWLVAQFHGLGPFMRLGRRGRLLPWLAALLPVAALGLGFAAINVTTSAVVLLHLALIWLIVRLALWAAGRLRGRPFSRDVAGVAAIAITVVYLGAGWFMAHHVFITRYELTTSKSLGQPAVRVAMFADSHLGITLNGERFARQMARLQAESPDAVMIVGDFVDDDTSASDMLRACEALGRLDAPRGVYFVFGNHDEGYFRYRNFTSAQLRSALDENGVVILEDRAVQAGEGLRIAGRRDRSTPGRAEASALTEGLDGSDYVIMLDHQPNDYAGEAASGADLVLSGHTHGGHLFPMGQIGLMIGANDRIYGRESRGDTTFIVTSGISGWAVPFKTGTFSEMVFIDITSEQS